MSKRKPDQVIVHRVELQQRERELLETAILADSVTKVIDAMAKVDITTMYAWLNIAEALGFVDTPIPTIGDGTVENAINGFAKGVKIAKEGVEMRGGRRLTIADIIRYQLTGEYPEDWVGGST